MLSSQADVALLMFQSQANVALLMFQSQANVALLIFQCKSAVDKARVTLLTASTKICCKQSKVLASVPQAWLAVLLEPSAAAAGHCP